MRKKHLIYSICFIMAFFVLFMNIQVLADPTINVTSVSLNKTTDTLTVGGTDVLVATVTPTNATNQQVVWTSSNASVATVNNGVVTAVSPGTAVIAATTADGTHTAACSVTVYALGTSSTQMLTLNKISDTLMVGGADTLTATMNSISIANTALTWTSSNPNIASVAFGTIMGINPGNTVITASDGTNTATCSVTVYPQGSSPIQSISLNKTSDSLTVGRTDMLTATVYPAGTSNSGVVWTTSNSNVVSVNSGVLTAKSPGNATITATTADGTGSAMCYVTVYAQGAAIPLQSITLNKTTDILTVGAIETLTASIYPTNATNFLIVWGSSNPNVIMVDNGVISAIGPGTAIVTAANLDGTIRASCNVIVNSPNSTTGETSSSTFNTTRLGGDDRYETSSAVSRAQWKGTSDYAVLSSGDDFPDGLSAAVLAKKYNAPILLTDKNSIPASVLTEITRLKINHIFITGGTGVVSQDVEKKLSSMGITTERLAGKNRYETSIKIAEKVGNTSGEVIVTDGYQWTDALSVSSIAAKKGIPIILTDRNDLPDCVNEYISNNKITKTYILGDTISDNVANKLTGVKRINGSNEYERNINIIRNFENDIDFKNICIASGRDFPDSLSGSVFAAMNSSAIVLVDDKNLQDVTAEYIKTKTSKIRNVYILGLQGAVSDNIVHKLFIK